VVDALRWKKKRNIYPTWITTDAVYLGGALISGISIAFATDNWEYENFTEFILTSVSSVFLGSIVWDLVFGTVKYNDAFHPFHNWYGGWGFKNKTQRITFDVGRLILGFGFIYLSELVSSDSKTSKSDKSDWSVNPIITNRNVGMNLNIYF
jgi:hypothetical protein